ncbi:uncharacterized protein LOC124305507 [Neodiprion virginianus]|uniref:Uncharacterized protein LOC107217228 n=1 Tax=Neodiprion lecontei TaxID=441921 RepID=A0A6J0B7G0_NEOLC|nr:uncharacterized protein LOC107217228 [Neodiprion lecontei]XP_046427020.1 uncharacterized protein LOC124183066 [Neodiprion fabricii]XP_046620995.1 uncharacterized protein LOC124305507 [Neodiprion virginianus]
MASTMARGPILPESGDADSDGSSGEDRDTLKRPHGDADSAGAKKRRKQSTPVRFPATLISDDREEESEEEGAAEDSEGKPTVDRIHQTSKDENLNNEFRCQYCSQLFDSKQMLNHHLNSKHNLSTFSWQNTQRSPVHSHIEIKQESNTHQEQPESPVNLSGIGIKNFAATWLSGHVQSQPHQIQLQSQTDDWPPPGSTGSLSSISNHLQALPFPGALAQYLPLPNFSLTDASQVPNRPPIGPAPVRIFNPDAYCDLCNKEFCNKYFLKTHKANKHGIYVDTPGQTPQLKLESPTVSMPPAQAVLQAPPSLNAVCEICQKKFKNEESVRKHKQKVHNSDGTEGSDVQMLPPQTVEDEKDTSHHSLSPGAMEGLFKQEFGVEQEDTTFMPAPRHLSPQSIQQAKDSGFNADRLKRLGVINPEAFCEVCCKEYCNKYFLRTHKMKRHGIVVQDNDKSPSNPGAAATWHHVQTSPLNLIVGETSGNSSESGDRSGEDYECKPCGIRFQTIGLHQAHRQKMHDSEEQGSPKNENDADTTDQKADSISEDLRKLQTMILQLNGLEFGRGAPCPICGKDYDSRQALRNHMAMEHDAIVDETVSSPLQGTEKSPTPNSSTALNSALCDKEFPSQEALRKHISEDHQPSTSASVPLPSALPTTSATMTSTTPTAPTPERRAPVLIMPTSSYCEICNKELCNKYFMKTHMHRMHGIEIENGAQIGGVICNICNKELCSKYFLRVHKHNTHGIIEEGMPSTSNSAKQADTDTNNSEDPALKPEQVGDLSHRYFTHFTEVCPICSRRFRSTKWLKAHLLSDHGKAGIEKWRELEQQYQSGPRGGRTPGPSRVSHPNPSLKIPNGIDLAPHMKTGDYSGLGNQVLSTLFGSTEDQPLKSYRCSYCTFTTPVLAFLFVHERSHTSPQSGTSIEGEQTLQCPVCLQGFSQPELLQHHLLTQHQFSGLIPSFQPQLFSNSRPESSSEKDSESKDRTDLDSKDDLKQVSPHTSAGLSSNGLPKGQRPEDATAVQVTPQGAYKCAQCGYATANLNRIKKHIRKDHRTVTADQSESVIGELTRTLRDVASKQKIPASYAMPQDMNSSPEKTVMQPFLIEESEAVHGTSDTASSEKKFGPALVYLPVRTRISAPLTLSFNLSPA